jgi:hypothetical protein
MPLKMISPEFDTKNFFLSDDLTSPQVGNHFYIVYLS